MDEEILFDLETDLKICNPTPTYLNVEKELFQNLKKFFQIVLDLFYVFPIFHIFISVGTLKCGYLALTEPFSGVIFWKLLSSRWLPRLIHFRS